MADQEQLERLTHSIDLWNLWRQKHPEIRPDLSYADLKGAYLNHANLGRANLVEATLNHAALNHTNFGGAKLGRADLSDADLCLANLSHADLNGANLSRADLCEAKLGRTFLIDAVLNRANLSRAFLSETILNKADLREANLSRATLTEARFNGANLNRANLREADLREADLIKSDLSGADLNRASLPEAMLNMANFEGADLSEAMLSGANFTRANLRGANLSRAILIRTILVRANLDRANLSHAQMWGTILGELDLRSVKGLETVVHKGPSNLSINTLYISHGNVPEIFVRGTGAPNSFIDYMPSLLTIPIQYHSLFLSHSYRDQAFIRHLHNDLQKQGVRCWLASHDLRPGTPIVRGIEEAIHLHEKLLLILSKDAVNSPWVQQEVEAALYKEVTTGREILFPIRLDNTVLESETMWAKRLCHRHIGDFTGWQDEVAYQQAFATLLQHLKVAQPPCPG